MYTDHFIKNSAYKLFKIDIMINWLLGLLFLLFYKPVEKLMSDGKLLHARIQIVIFF
jgi:hypothetical protein